MNDMQSILGIIAAISSISVIITGGAVYVSKTSSGRLEERTKELINGIKESQLASNQIIMENINQLRNHLDSRLQEVNQSFNEKNSELKAYVSSEFTKVNEKIAHFESTQSNLNDRQHELEKYILRLENKLAKEYVTHSELKEVKQKLSI